MACCDKLILGVLSNEPADKTPTRIQVRLGEDEAGDEIRPTRGERDRDRATQAVAEHTATLQRKVVKDLGDGIGVLFQRIAKVERSVAVPMAEEVHQHSAMRGHAGFSDHHGKVRGASASQSVDEDEGQFVTGEVEIANNRFWLIEGKNVHQDKSTGGREGSAH